MYSKTLIELSASDVRSELRKRGLSTAGGASDLYIRLEDALRSTGADPHEFSFWVPEMRETKEPEADGETGAQGRTEPIPGPTQPTVRNEPISTGESLTHLIAAFMQQAEENRALLQTFIRRMDDMDASRNRYTWDPKVLDFSMVPFEGHPYEDPEIIVRRWERGLTDNRVPRSCWVEVATRYLGNDVHRLWRKQCRTDATWEEFADFLLTRYADVSDVSALRASFHGDRQKAGEDVEGFIQNKFAIFRRLYPEDSEASFICQVIELIDPRLRQILRLGATTSVAAFAAVARRIEGDQNMASRFATTNRAPLPRYGAPREQQRNQPTFRQHPADHLSRLRTNYQARTSWQPQPSTSHQNSTKPPPRMSSPTREQVPSGSPPQREKLLGLGTKDRGPHIPFRLEDRVERLALVDTQASTSFVNGNFAALPGVKHVANEEKVVQLGTKNRHARTLGQVNFYITIQGKRHRVAADILPDLPAELILGQDWLTENDVTINFKSKSCTIGVHDRYNVSWRLDHHRSAGVSSDAKDPVPSAKSHERAQRGSEGQPPRVNNQKRTSARLCRIKVKPGARTCRPAPSASYAKKETGEDIPTSTKRKGERPQKIHKEEGLMRRIISEQLQDPELRNICSWIQGETKPKHPKQRRAWARQRRNFEVTDGLVYYLGDQPRLYVPHHLRSSVICRYHDHPSANHPGYEKTLESLRSQLYWPGMVKATRDHIRKCKVCVANKPLVHKPCATPVLSRTETIWEVGTDDLLCSYPLPQYDKTCHQGTKAPVSKTFHVNKPTVSRIVRRSYEWNREPKDSEMF